MNLKDTLILLIFLLSVLGLIIGVYYTADATSENSHGSNFERLHEENGSVLTVSWEKKDNDDLNIVYGRNHVTEHKMVQVLFPLVFRLYPLLKRDYVVLFATFHLTIQNENYNAYQLCRICF